MQLLWQRAAVSTEWDDAHNGFRLVSSKAVVIGAPASMGGRRAK